MGLPIPFAESSLQKKATSSLGEDNGTYTAVQAALRLTCHFHVAGGRMPPAWKGQESTRLKSEPVPTSASCAELLSK